MQKLVPLYLQAKGELNDLKLDCAREMDDLMENIRQLNQESQLQMLLIDHFIPKNFQVRP